MNSRRLVRLLQAVSYDIPDRGHSVPARDICENRISIKSPSAPQQPAAVPQSGQAPADAPKAP